MYYTVKRGDSLNGVCGITDRITKPSGVYGIAEQYRFNIGLLVDIQVIK